MNPTVGVTSGETSKTGFAAQVRWELLPRLNSFRRFNDQRSHREKYKRKGARTQTGEEGERCRAGGVMGALIRVWDHVETQTHQACNGSDGDTIKQEQQNIKQLVGLFVDMKVCEIGRAHV